MSEWPDPQPIKGRMYRLASGGEVVEVVRVTPGVDDPCPSCGQPWHRPPTVTIRLRLDGRNGKPAVLTPGEWANEVKEAL